MIKIMMSIALLLLSEASFAQTQAKILPVDIRGVSCQGGSGLCSAMSNFNKENTNSIYVVKESLNTIFLVIDASQLTIEEQKNCFGKEYSKMISNNALQFTQDGDFVFDEKTLLYLGLDPKYTSIKKGSYTCEISKDKIQVKMTLWEK
ncbi:hypothetical protein EQG63_03145 [Flavobacterium amnicola]|uniref:Uncharacterized protein n=1 Tax=Flavobacterium amnicola TaxID=2506422 RepID=A0A4Q1K589_9FLAO|nr:hypothetical protein [Flavobacterium amnicola]RXR20948.1 hypothetical protein EQG63_03145 [Flavobacterium amnicola]